MEFKFSFCLEELWIYFMHKTNENAMENLTEQMKTHT